jgi:DNA-binding NarL/FixJ family response regulator
MILYDFGATDNSHCILNKNDLLGSRIPAGILLALFNVCQGEELEKFALQQGMRGIFYRDDDAEIIVKGINAMFLGELWVQRKILEECLIQGLEGSGSAPASDVIVTDRETEILTLIAVGAKNEEIAEKLCIESLAFLVLISYTTYPT